MRLRWQNQLDIHLSKKPDLRNGELHSRLRKPSFLDGPYCCHLHSNGLALSECFCISRPIISAPLPLPAPFVQPPAKI